MSPTIVGTIVFVCTAGGALFGSSLRGVLPAHHLDGESRDVVKLGIGLIATMTALVLGLVTASARGSFDGVDAAVRHTAMDLIALDRLLARYGPETGEIRRALQHGVARRIDMIWPQDSSSPIELDPSVAGSSFEQLADAIRRLTPRDELQTSLQSRAVDLAEALLHARWMVFAGGGTSIPRPFLGVLLFWLTITFGTFGLLAPRNATVLSVLFVCALSVGSAVFLILELDGPFDGLLRVSAEPIRYAHAHLNQ